MHAIRWLNEALSLDLCRFVRVKFCSFRCNSFVLSGNKHLKMSLALIKSISAWNYWNWSGKNYGPAWRLMDSSHLILRKSVTKSLSEIVFPLLFFLYSFLSKIKARLTSPWKKVADNMICSETLEMHTENSPKSSVSAYLWRTKKEDKDYDWKFVSQLIMLYS